jgi:DNA-binding winged helix-turn-helix (wHTH) protein
MKTTKPPRLPKGRVRAEVLVFQPELTHSVWIDHMSGHRTVDSLRQSLRKSVRKGEYVGYRIHTIHEEHIGCTWEGKP